MPFPLTFVDGKVGIGVSSPDAELDVNGDVDISGTLTVAGASVGTVSSVGAFGSTPNANGASIAAGVLTLQPASVTQPGGVSIAAQTFNGAKTFDDGVLTNSVTSATAAPVAIASSVANGASAIAATINSSVALSTSGAKLLSVQNNSIEKLYVDKDGAVVAGASVGLGGDVGTSYGIVRSSANIVFCASGGTFRFTDGSVNQLILDATTATFPGAVKTDAVTSATAAPVVITSSVADGAAAIAAKVNSSVALANATAKLLSIQNNSVEKAYVDKDGNLLCQSVYINSSAHALGYSGSATIVSAPNTGQVRFQDANSGVHWAVANVNGVEVDVVGQGFILKSPNGTRYMISVNDAGLLSTVAAS